MVLASGLFVSNFNVIEMKSKPLKFSSALDPGKQLSHATGSQ